MAENKKSFVLYADFISTFEELSDEESGQLIKHIFRYVNDQDPIAQDKLIKIAFEPIKQQLKRDLVKYETIKEKRSAIGKKGGIKSGESRRENAERDEANEANASIPKANEAVTDTVNVNDTVTVINKGAKALTVSSETPPPPSKDDYQKLTDEYTGKDLTTVVTAMKDFLSKKPPFLEPYRDYWNIAVDRTSVPKVKTISDTRTKKLKTRIREPDFDFVKIINKVHGSKKLKSEGSWFSFDWVFENEGNYVKILEGNYDN